jgi:hypothetical protein
MQDKPLQIKVHARLGAQLGTVLCSKDTIR